MSSFSLPATAFPFVSGQEANFRQGQSDWAVGFVDPAEDPFFGAELPSAATLFAPAEVRFDAATQTLIVSDTLNRRILFFDANGGGSFGGQATLVLGQPDALTGGSDPLNPYGNSNTANAAFGCEPGVNACGVRRPFGLAIDSSQRLFVADPDNRRVVIWNLAGGTSDGMAAEWVLGQKTMTTDDLNQACEGGESATATGCGLAFPSAVALDEARNLLFVADTANNRVLLFDTSDLTSGMVAIGVLGQPSLTSRGANAACSGAGSANACGLSSPGALAYDPLSQTLFVGDYDNHRVVAYNLASIPANGPPADAVIGQPDFATSTVDTSCGGGAAGSVNGCGLGDHGVGLVVTPTELFVSDTANHRVLSFPLSGLVDGQAATGILGQTSFTVGYNGADPALGGRTDRQSFVSPQGMSYDPAVDRLFVADAGNHRVVVFGVNVGGVAVEATGDIASASTVENGDGSVSIQYTGSGGESAEIVFPSGTTGQDGEAIATHVYSENGTLAIEIRAELPPGETKSVTVPAGGGDVCVVDREIAIFSNPVICAEESLVVLPAAGACASATVRGELGDNPSDPLDELGNHSIMVCTSADGLTATVSGLLHTRISVTLNSDVSTTNDDREAIDDSTDDETDPAQPSAGCSSSGTSTGGTGGLFVLLLLGLWLTRRVAAYAPHRRR